MSGTMIVGTLLRANAALIEIISEEWIKIAELPEDAPMDAILIRSVSMTERQFLSVGSASHCTERVSVAVRTSKYRSQDAILKLVRASCHGFTGALLDATSISIRTDGRGPDLRGPGGSFEKTQDFRVAYTILQEAAATSLSGTVSSAAILTASLEVSRLLTGEMMSGVLVGGEIVARAALSGHVAGAAGFAGGLLGAAGLRGDVAGLCAYAGALQTSATLAGQAECAGVVTGTLNASALLIGSAIAAGTATAAMTNAVPYDADAQSYFAAMTVQPTAARKTIINDFIVGLKADGVWNSFDWLMLFAAHDRQAGRINVRYPAKLVNLANNPSFTVDRGYFGDGSSSFVDIGESPSKAGNLYAQDDAHIGLWCNLNGSQSGIVFQMGQLSGTQFTVIRPTSDGGNDGYSVNANSVSAARTGGTSRTGHRTLSRIAGRSGEMKAFFNGERTATNAVASTGVPTTMVIGRSLTNFSRDRFAAAYMGGGLQEAQVAALHNRLNTYLTAIGAN